MRFGSYGGGRFSGGGGAKLLPTVASSSVMAKWRAVNPSRRELTSELLIAEENRSILHPRAVDVDVKLSPSSKESSSSESPSACIEFGSFSRDHARIEVFRIVVSCLHVVLDLLSISRATFGGTGGGGGGDGGGAELLSLSLLAKRTERAWSLRGSRCFFFFFIFFGFVMHRRRSSSSASSFMAAKIALMSDIVSVSVEREEMCQVGRS
mmetsp:Transcript_10771/g.23369  ORF Transcript_10771/g.23369 Transcript_10771/m.23369 type:complete len:209 (-) Transcript_10771:2271-2897(-)